MVKDEIWEALYEVEPPEVPYEAIRFLIEEGRRDPETESELVEELESQLEDAKDPDHFDIVFWWLVVILGETKSEKAIPYLIQCFDLKDYDFIYELAQKALTRIGEKATKAVMEWLDREPPWDSRLYAYSILENTLDYATPAFRVDIKEFLKRRVLIEQRKPAKDECMDPALQSLAYFSGDDVVKFVRNVVRRYEYHPALNAALEIAEGRFDISRKNSLNESWEEICKSYAQMAAPDEKKDKNNPKYSSEYLCRDIREKIKKKKWKEVEPLAKKLKERYRYEWAGPDFLASCYMTLGRREEAKAEIQEALRRIHHSWKMSSRITDYQDVDRLEAKVDSVLGRGKPAFFSRVGDYLEGLLIPLGAIKSQSALQALKSLIFNPASLREEEIFPALLQDTRFKFFEDYIALSEVEDVSLLIEEREKRNLDLRLPANLNEIKLSHEGRRDYDDWELEADKDIRIFTEGKWNLESVRRVIRKDVVGRRNTDALISRMRVYPRDFLELVDVINESWNKTTRWELAGRTPEEVWGANPKAEEEFSPHVHVTSFAKVGRNDLCPCGSGKKFKKCCLDKEQTV